MTNEQAATKLTNIAHDDIYAWHPSILEAFRMAVEALKAQLSREDATSDCISRQAAIELIERMKPYHQDADDIVEMITNMPSAQPEPKWIPCSERLPKEEKKTYWVCTDTEYQCECRWTNNRFGIGDGEWGWSIFDTPQYSKPIAWRPLPEPYKENKDERD